MGAIITLASSKGGSGKSTVTFHIATELMKRGYSVSVIDIDTKKNSYYLFQRRDELAFFLTHGHMPSNPIGDYKDVILQEEYLDLIPSVAKKKIAGGIPTLVSNQIPSGDLTSFSVVVERARDECEVLIIDTGGGDLKLNRRAMSYSDLVITPILPSVLDMDALLDTVTSIEDVIANRPDLKVKSIINQRPTHVNDFRSNALKVIIKQFPTLANSFKTNLDFYFAYRDSLSFGLGACEWSHSKANAQVSNLVQEIIQELSDE